MRYLLLFSFISIQSLLAQTHLNYANYWHVLGSYNPGAITSNHDASAGGIVRKQWIGIAESPFVTEFISDVRIPKINTSFGLIGSFSSVGFFRNFNSRTQAAYRFNFDDDDFYLQAGIDLGFASISIQNASWITGSQQPDPSIPSNNSNDIGLTLGSGLFLNHPSFLFSVSCLSINQPQLNEINVTLRRLLFATAGLKLNFGEKGVLMPLASFESDLTSTSYTFNLVSTYDERLSAGIGLRVRDAFIFTGSYSTKSIRFGYAYELTISALSAYSRGSHEFFVSWYLPKQ